MLKAHPLLNWDETKKIITEGSLEKLGRSAEQHEKYKKFSKQLLLEWNTVSDYIKVSKIGLKKLS